MPEDTAISAVNTATPAWIKTTTWLLALATAIIIVILFLLWWRYNQVLHDISTIKDNGTSQSSSRQNLSLNGSELSITNGNTVDLNGLTSNLASQLQPAAGPQGTSGNKGTAGSAGAAGAKGSVGVAVAQNGVTLSGSTLELGTSPLLHDTYLPQGGNDLYLDASVNNGSFIAVGDPATVPNVLIGAPGPGNPLAISGPGERLIWYPRKMALRAGAIDTQALDFSPFGGGNYAGGTGWDDANIGIGSMAIGYDTIAKGGLSTALGAYNDAEGSFNSILGAFNVVAGQGNVAIGGINQMLGNNSINLGLGQLGFFGGGTCFTKTAGSYDFNVGICNDLESNNSTIIGDFNTTDIVAHDNFIAGDHNSSSAPNAFVMGHNNTITGAGFAGLIGISSIVSGSNSLGIGTGLAINGNNSILMGYNLTSDVGANNTFGVNVDDTTPVTMSNANVIGFYGGKVGVNQTNPTHRFEVTDTTTNTTAAFTGTTQTCIVDTSGPGGWNCTSDQRLKTNILDLSGSLDKLMQLQGVTYNFKTNTTGDPIAGFIAQDVQKILPDLVGKDVNGYLNLNKEGMIPYIVEAIKTQNGKLDETNTQLAAYGLQLSSISDNLKKLSGVVDDHEKRIQDLEAEVKTLKQQQTIVPPPIAPLPTTTP